MNKFRTLDGECRTEFEIERSRFIATAVRVDSADDVKDTLIKIRKEFSDATHNCYAYMIGNEQKASDDGEPQGTAGVPILEAIKRSGLDKVLIVVTRYFGGIKLGAAGLLSAYMKSATDALNAANVAEFIYSDVVTVDVDYTLYQKLSQYISSVGVILDTVYGDGVSIKFAVPTDAFDAVKLKISELSSGKVAINRQESNYFKYKR